VNTAFIGDIHGCLEELIYVSRRALAEAERLVFLGDYVDRGPNSKAVIDELISLKSEYPQRTVFLGGNHDAEFIRVLKTDVAPDLFLRMGGAKTIRSYLEPPYEQALPRLRSEVPRSHLEFLSTLQPAYFGVGVMAVHDKSDIAIDGRFVVAGHNSQASLKPRITQDFALIDTGCGTIRGGRLTCFVWPSKDWWQSP